MRHAGTRTWAVPVAVTLALAVIASCSGNNDSAPTTTSQTAETSTTPTSGAAPAQDVVTGFLEAHVAFDAEEALTYLTDEAVQAAWGDAESFRLEHALLEAQGYQEIVTGCEPQGDAGVVDIRCYYDFHGIRSAELGLGPYSDNYWGFIVEDGKITYAGQAVAYATNGFASQMWSPFGSWVSANYPDDVPRMYTKLKGSYLLSEESVRLWEQHTREYVQQMAPQSPGTPTSR